MTLPDALVEPLVRAALAEDLGRAGDLTTNACIPADAAARYEIRARADGVLAGLGPARLAWRLVDPEVTVESSLDDGARLTPGALVATVSGPTRAILTGERVALNFLGHLSGVATATATLVDAVAHTSARIADTRKTTPGLRPLEKAAVRAGGGTNHRFGLDDAVMIKDNHVAAAGGITEAVAAVRRHVGHTVRIEVEVDTLGQLRELLEAPVDIVLLDNMSLEELREAVALVDGRMITEASGNISAATVTAVAETGVDIIAVGAITHSAPTLDLGLDAVGVGDEG